MKKFYTVSKKQDQELTVAQIMNSLLQIQTWVEESRENQEAIQVWSPLLLYTGGD